LKEFSSNHDGKCRLREQSEKSLCPQAGFTLSRAEKETNKKFYAWKPRKEKARQLAFDIV